MTANKNRIKKKGKLPVVNRERLESRLMPRTTRGQSGLLIRHGLPKTTADLCYRMCDGLDRKQHRFNRLELFDRPHLNDLPCWSLGALIGLLPDSPTSSWQLTKGFIGADEKFDPDMFYINWNDSSTGKSHWECMEDRVGVLVRMILWLLDNGIIPSTAPYNNSHMDSVLQVRPGNFKLTPDSNQQRIIDKKHARKERREERKRKRALGLLPPSGEFIMLDPNYKEKGK